MRSVFRHRFITIVVFAAFFAVFPIAARFTFFSVAPRDFLVHYADIIVHDAAPGEEQKIDLLRKVRYEHRAIVNRELRRVRNGVQPIQEQFPIVIEEWEDVKATTTLGQTASDVPCGEYYYNYYIRIENPVIPMFSRDLDPIETNTFNICNQ